MFAWHALHTALHVLHSGRGDLPRVEKSSHLVPPCVQIHDEVPGLRVPVPDLALVTIRVPGHLLGLVSILFVDRQELVVLGGQHFQGLALKRRTEDNRVPTRKKLVKGHIFSFRIFIVPPSRFSNWGRPRDCAVLGHVRVVLQGRQRVGRVKIEPI